MTKKVVKKASKKLGSAKVVKKVPLFKVSLTVNGETTTFGTDNLHESLISFVPPPLVKTDLEFEVKSGKKTVNQAVSVQKARRVFGNKTALELLAVNILRRLG